MHGSERREQIIRQIQESKAPVSGTKLASLYILWNYRRVTCYVKHMEGIL